jgi:hypothetical protein
MSNDFSQKNDKIFQQILPLHKADVGRSYKIVNCQLLPDIKTRLAEMGLVNGTVVTVVKRRHLATHWKYVCVVTAFAYVQRKPNTFW